MTALLDMVIHKMETIKLEFVPGRDWYVPVSTIREVYSNDFYGVDHPLRKRLVWNTAIALNSKSLWKHRRNLIGTLARDFEEFRLEVELCQSTLTGCGRVNDVR